MVTFRSGITWFEEEDWIGREIVFDSPIISRWKVTEKIKESGDCESEIDVKEWNAESSCRGVFVCLSLNHPGKEAVVKIRMQYVLLASLPLLPPLSPARFPPQSASFPLTV